MEERKNVKRTKPRKYVSAKYDPKSGLLQRTLSSGVTISVLFAGLGIPKNGKKGVYLDFSNYRNMVGQKLPIVVNNGIITYPGFIHVMEYTEANHGSYRVMISVGNSKMKKLLKNHDLATLWCVATAANSLMLHEEAKLLKKIEMQQKKEAKLAGQALKDKVSTKGKNTKNAKATKAKTKTKKK